jgi:glycosyl transferase, family 25
MTAWGASGGVAAAKGPSSAAPVYVVSLPDSPRRIPIAQRLTELGIPFRLCDAVDGRTLTANEVDAGYHEAGALRRMGRTLTRAEVGCALSHRLVYRMMLHEGLACAVVLEDDAIIANDFAAFCRACAGLPEAIELLSLHAEHGFVRRKPSFQWGGGAIHKAMSNLSTTVGYFIRRSVAQKVLAGSKPIETVADWPFDHRSVQHYLMVPMTVGHARDGSMIHAGRNVLQPRLLGGFARIAQFVETVSYLRYVTQRARYDGLLNYHDREVGPRLMRRMPFLYLDVGRMPDAAR